MADFILLLLLISPIPLPVPRHAPAPLWNALKRAAVLLELWAPTSKWNEQNFASEVAWTRDAWRQLRDCPPLGDLDFLPSADAARGMVSFCEARKQFLERCSASGMYQADSLVTPREDNAVMLRGWRLILEARTDFRWSGRRESLRELRAMGWGNP